MASISTDKKGNRTIQFKADDGKRRSIRLGKVRARDANEFRTKLEQLLSSQAVGRAPDLEVTDWISRLPKKMTEKLAGFGLLPGREQQDQVPPDTHSNLK